MDKLTKVLSLVVLIVIGILITIGSLENGILLSILSFAFIILFIKKTKIRNFSLFLIIFSLVTKLIAAFIIKVPLAPDYQTMYDASTNVINGDFSFMKSGYFIAYGYQLGHVFYQALILKIINSIFALKVMNCIFSTIITLLIYLILKKFTKEDTARIVTLVYSISLYPIYLNSILGNQQLSLMLFLLGIYMLLTKKSTILNGIIIGVLFALGNIERPEGIIFILTLIIYNIFTLKNIKIILKSTLPIIVVYFLITEATSFALIKSGASETGLGSSDPYWKFLIGFNYDYNGKNNLEDYEFTVDPELEKEEVIKRVTDFKKMPNLFYNKIKIQWLYDDLDTTFNATNTTLFSQNIIKLGVNYIKMMNLIIIFLAFVGIIKNNMSNKIPLFFMINTIIYFGVYLLIEVSARYYYSPNIAIIILSSLGLERILNSNILKKSISTKIT